MVLGTRVWPVVRSMSPAESHDRFPRLLQGVLRNGIEGVAGRFFWCLLLLCLALGCYPQTTQMAIWLEKSRIIYNVLYSIGMGGPLVQTKPCKIYWGSIISRAVPAWICCRHRKWKWNLDKLNGLALFLSVLHCRWARQHRFLPLKPWK